MASATEDELAFATVAAAALVMADEVLSTGKKSPAKQVVKKTSNDAGAAAGAGAGAGAGTAGAIKKAGAAAGAGTANAIKEAGGTAGAASNTKLRLTEAVRPEALERARDMCFSSNQPLPLDCPQTKPTR